MTITTSLNAAQASTKQNRHLSILKQEREDLSIKAIERGARVIYIHVCGRFKTCSGGVGYSTCVLVELRALGVLHVVICKAPPHDSVSLVSQGAHLVLFRRFCRRL